MRGRQWHILPKILVRVTRPNKAALKLPVLVRQQQCRRARCTLYNVHHGLSERRGMVQFGAAEQCMGSWGHHAQVMRALAAILLQYTM